ncbi:MULTISPECIES: hypothetical protein [Paenibacillus]|uniref:Uncharacterized protein n=1 Tax=Paenibacillus pabuli TaxID=1472 RepID=A0A855Y400_9BACL|nr:MULTISPECIES: hypothetical protein [Paenibacillus]PWW45469.1 hypothetical protein DET56_101678 [Paenibacillus pabuli]PXW11806.1 hypothetical protein DEU73_101677 [Paenibacillus taichungensis]RAI84484.1 hypothetical protein DET54_12562 [Paenibacillus pabuli]
MQSCAFWRASHSVAMVDARKFWHHGVAIVLHQVLPSRKCARDGSMSTALMHAVQPREELPHQAQHLILTRLALHKPRPVLPFTSKASFKSEKTT